MLNIINLSKAYQSESGVKTLALDNINLNLPSSGMVFVTGKSGSGKSTLLNLIGGIDTPTGGEIIVHGKSLNEFTPKDYDAYRNTYVGFIYQEYYLLKEYSVKSNIALSYELQGGKVTDELLENALIAVDMQGQGKKRPNELSGGQQQRTAIARALIKNPDIILADEPTGNLDGATGGQIMRLLRKVSAERLVIIVSHDTDAAAKYGDRIITLSDGKIARDIINHPESEEEDGLIVSGKEVILPDRALTDEEIDAINEIEACKLSVKGAKAVKKQNIKPANREDTKSYSAEKSRLPFKNIAFMGLNNYKLKPLKFIVTVILSLISLVSLGLAMILSGIDNAEAAAKVFKENNIKTISIYQRHYYLNPPDNEKFLENIEKIKNKYGTIDIFETYIMDYNVYQKIDYDLTKYIEVRKINIIPEAGLPKLGIKVLIGEYPEADEKQIAITDYLMDLLIEGGIYSSREDAIGKPFNIYGQDDYIISGVLNTDYKNIYKDIIAKGIDYYGDRSDEEILFLFDRALLYMSIYAADSEIIDNLYGMREDYIRKIMLSEESYIEAYNLKYMKNVFSGFGFELFKYGGNVYENYQDIPEINLNDDEIIISEYELRGLLPEIANLEEAVFPQDATINGDNYKIVGAYKMTHRSGRFVNENVFASLESVKEIYNNYEQIAVLSDSYLYNREFLQDIDNSKISHSSPYSEFIYGAVGSFQEISIIFSVMGAILYCLSIGLTSSLIRIGIKLRKREIGILRALGASNSDTKKIFLFESFALSTLVFLLSTAGLFILCNFSAQGFYKFFEIYMTGGIFARILYVTIESILLIFFIAYVISALAVLEPLNKFNKMHPLDMIKGYFNDKNSQHKQKL